MPVQLNLTYCQRPSGPLAFDVYFPDSRAKALVLFAHGGGFSRGARATVMVERLAKALGDEGYAMASVSYRLHGTGDDLDPDWITPVRKNRRRTLQAGLTLNPRLYGQAFEVARQDIGEAFALLRSRVRDWPVDSDKIGMVGVSAGCIAGLSLAYPPDNLPTPGRPDAVFALCSAMVQPWRLEPNGPPCLMLHSRFDRIIGPENTHLAKEAAQKAAAPLDVMICDREGHNAPVRALFDDTDATGRSYWDHMVGFFDKTLSPTPAGV